MQPIYVDLDTDAAVCVDGQTTFMPAHAFAGVQYAAGGLAVRDGHKIIDVILDRLFRIFPLGHRYATCDVHEEGSVSFADSFLRQPENAPILLDEVRGWTKANHRIAPHALFTLEQFREYLEQLEERALRDHGVRGGGVQIAWKKHAMKGTPEGRLHPAISERMFAYVQIKGLDDPCCDSYSGLLDNLGRPVGLGERLRKDKKRRLFVFGLAWDFCVKWTVINALRDYGFDEVYVVLDATYAVDLPGNEAVAGSVDKAMRDLIAVGAKFCTTDQLRLATKPF